MQMDLKHLVYWFLDRPGGRATLARIGSLRETRRTGTRCRVRYDAGFWLHRFGAVTIPRERIGTPSPSALAVETHDFFCYGYTPKAGDIVLDVGAGVGTEVLAFSDMVGASGRVFAIEAHPATFAVLDRLREENSLGNVVTEHLAIADRPCVLRISDVEVHIENSLVSDESPGVDVRAMTLDEFARLHAIERIDFLKMNIEGAEALAIRGMDDVIGRIKNVAISCHDFLAERGGSPQTRTKAAVRAFLEGHGFKLRSRPGDPRAFIRDFLYGSRET